MIHPQRRHWRDRLAVTLFLKNTGNSGYTRKTFPAGLRVRLLGHTLLGLRVINQAIDRLRHCVPGQAVPNRLNTRASASCAGGETGRSRDHQ
jgi:hypothetical protein